MSAKTRKHHRKQDPDRLVISSHDSSAMVSCCNGDLMELSESEGGCLLLKNEFDDDNIVVPCVGFVCLG